MSKKSLFVVLTLIVVTITGFVIWRVQSTRATVDNPMANSTAVNSESQSIMELTAEEIKSVLESQATADGEGVGGIARSPETRQAFLKGMREYLALAAQARHEGLTEDSLFKASSERQKNVILSSLYRAKLNNDTGKYYQISEEEVNAFWSDPENEKRYNADTEAVQTVQRLIAEERGTVFVASKPQGEGLQKSRRNWASMRILAAKAKADQEFMSQPAISLRLKVAESGILASAYIRKYWSKEIKATEQEIAAYLQSHPEYDLNQKRIKAESVLRRARAGEDFDRLCKDHSEHRPTKNIGGLFKDVVKDQLWKEVEDAALKLENGQVADKLVESELGYHIVKLVEKRSVKEDNGESVTYDVKHILFQNKFEEPGPVNPDVPPPFMEAEQIARAEIEKEKRNKFVTRIVQQNPVGLPDDFTVELPQRKNSGSFVNPSAKVDE